MKAKFLFLIVLFLGISALTFAQSQSAAPVQSKDAPAVVASPDQAKTGECAGHQTTATKADCKWVDANSDGICDICGSKDKDCKSKPAAAPKSGCAASCQYHKECGKSMGSLPAKDGKKDE